MATKVWVGGDVGGTGDVTIAANWLPAVVPADTETVIFPSHVSYAVDGLATFPADATTNNGLTEVIIEDGVSYDIGSRTLRKSAATST